MFAALPELPGDVVGISTMAEDFDGAVTGVLPVAQEGDVTGLS